MNKARIAVLGVAIVAGLVAWRMASGLDKEAPVEPVIWVSRGRVMSPVARRVEEFDGWRAHFDLRVDGTEPISMRCFLRIGHTALTETWVYQYSPA